MLEKLFNNSFCTVSADFIPQNGLESRVTRNRGPRNFVVFPKYPIFAQVSSENIKKE